MKRTLEILLAIGFVAMFLISPVAAATNQGLDWGFGVNDRMDFTFVVEDEDESISENMYFDIQSTPNIPDSITSWSQIPIVTVQGYWANDTSIGLYGLIFFGLLTVGSRFAVPTGNWTLLRELVSPVLTGEQIIDDLFYWGIVWSEDTSSTQEARISAIFYKSDGFLAKYLIETWDTSTDTRIGHISVIRAGFMTTIADNYILIGAGVVVVILLAVVCMRRK